MDSSEPGGHEIFVDDVSVGYVPSVPGTGLTAPLAEPMGFLGFEPEQCDDAKFRESLITDDFETTEVNLSSLAETWLWEDRLRRGELTRHRGAAA
jgi:hypothetical protein